MQECSTCLKFQFAETAVSWQDLGNAGFRLNFHCQAEALKEKDPQTYRRPAAFSAEGLETKHSHSEIPYWGNFRHIWALKQNQSGFWQ